MSDPLASVSLARKRQEQVQQADEDVVDIEEQVERRRDVVRLAAAHDVADVVQDVERKDQNSDRRDRERHRGYRKEQVRERRDDQENQADEQELAQKREIALGDGGDPCHRQEDRAGHPARESNQLAAILELRGNAQDRRQHRAGDEREAEQRRNAPGAVAKSRDD